MHGPFVVLFEQDRANQADDGVIIWEDADDLGVAEVARKYGVTRWQVYDWRKRLRHGSVTLPESMAAAPPLRRCWSKSRLSRGRPAPALISSWVIS
ncbi:MAG: helix-turn-helix domain-containing protein [Mesorhizobium sp.]|nr:MAG: helix-turn-helix domain-containing protein [Mesorhizobium sp.]RWE88047.1 MAG: helix-turn-helix domain-containing protein [Mesorhizobium sp.]TIW15121.1 MAG: helix-turn-helix domain-containing protein [Mesorhizobium sp.]